MISNKKIRRENYSVIVWDTFELIATFFINKYYNFLYSQAKTKIQIGGKDTLTDTFRNMICLYTYGIKKDTPSYKKEIDSLHEYFKRVTAYSSISFDDFVNRIVKQFVPERYFIDFNNQDKDSVLQMVVVACAEQLAGIIVDPQEGFMREIIDNRAISSASTIERLKTKTIEILVLKRELLFNEFIAKNSGVKTSESSNLKKMSAALAKETKMRCEYEADIKKSAVLLKDMYTTIEKQNAEIAELRRELMRQTSRQNTEPANIGLDKGMRFSSRFQDANTKESVASSKTMATPRTKEMTAMTGTQKKTPRASEKQMLSLSSSEQPQTTAKQPIRKQATPIPSSSSEEDIDKQLEHDDVNATAASIHYENANNIFDDNTLDSWLQ